VGWLIFGIFVDWWSFGGASGDNAFDTFFTGTIPWLLIVASGVITFLVAGDVLKAKVPWPVVILAATALGTLLVLLRLIIGRSIDTGFAGDIDLDRGAGIWLSTLSGIVATVGAFLWFQASGGNLSDLTDVDKLRGQ